MATTLPARLDFATEQTFPWVTLAKRMPVIATQVVNEVHLLLSEIVKDRPTTDASVEEPKEVKDARKSLEDLSRLKYEMQTNKVITDINDGGSDQKEWNEYIALHRIERSKPELHWFESSWLLAECYMYRRISSALMGSTLMASFDPFEASKKNSYHASMVSITGLGEFITCALNVQSDDQTHLKSTFAALVQFALWGNKSDLSLHTTMDSEMVKRLQVDSSNKVAELKENILCDHTEQLWKRLCDVKTKSDAVRVDIVLDNAGFELFTDLCLAHWLITKNFAATIHFHTKVCPWFVSDTSNADFKWVVAELQQSSTACLKDLGIQFQSHLDNSRWVLKSNPFWTYPHEFPLIAQNAPQLKADMDTAHLILLKGDLNYRKLLSDRAWQHDADFSVVTNGFSNTSYCSLRTLKANLVCGLNREVADQTQKKHPDGSWMTTGTFGIIQGHFTN